jgi:hypothetical protein
MIILRSYSATTTQLGPQAQWRFDEAGGAIAVDSADGLNSEYNGSVTFGQTGPVGADKPSGLAATAASSGSSAPAAAASRSIWLAGAGNGFTPVAELAGISGPNPNQLMADGNLELT